MRPDDVAIVADADETFTRDFLRALQICEIPAFGNDQDCHKPKLLGSSMVFESSSECIRKDTRWHHPDAVLGACVELIGNSTLHPTAIREWTKSAENESDTNSIKVQSSHGSRREGYGLFGNFSLVNYSNYPLWSAEDIRSESGGEMVAKADGSPTAYHFHNFFDRANDIHFKYYTYGHFVMDAMKIPFWNL